jgi:hypothetical protein
MSESEAKFLDGLGGDSNPGIQWSVWSVHNPVYLPKLCNPLYICVLLSLYTSLHTSIPVLLKPVYTPGYCVHPYVYSS